MYLRCYNGGMDEIDTNQELDKAIRQFYGRRTPRHIAERVGVLPEDVIRRAQEMTDEADAISIEAGIYLLMGRLNDIAADAQSDAASATDSRDKAGLYSAAVSAITQSLKQLNVLKKENDSAVVELNNQRVLELLRLFDVIVSRGAKQLSESHGLKEEDIKEVFMNNITIAAKELDNK